jgi:hypothetical protein
LGSLDAAGEESGFGDSDAAVDWQTSFEPRDTCDQGLTAFQNSVHALVRERCVACHERGPGPAFAVPDVAQSYAHILRYVNFDDIPNSYFVTKGGNMHCQLYGVNCQTNQADVEAVLRGWWDAGEDSCPRKGRFFSEAVALPTELPSRQQGFVPMRWSLQTIDQSLLRGAVFEVEVQKFADAGQDAPGAYRFRKPRLASPDKHLRVENVKLLVNGKFDVLANAYTAIASSVTAKAIPSAGALGQPVLSAKPMIVPEDIAGADKIVVSFEVLQQESAARTCRAQTSFTQNVLPVVTARNCRGCHGDAAQVAGQRFFMSADNGALCNEFLQRVDFNVLMNSPLIDYPLRGANDHARIIPRLDEVTPAWTDWIRAERPALLDDGE